MTNYKTPKNADDFICNKCNFKCSKMSDYKRHTNTSKHTRLTITNDKTPKNAKSYSCVCGKVYIHSSSLCKHKNTCTFIYGSVVLAENLEEKPYMMEILSQNK